MRVLRSACWAADPLICEHTHAVQHGGNFYGSHITHVADTVKLHLAHAA